MKIGDKFEIDDYTVVAVVSIIMMFLTIIFTAPYMK